jgi:hypothetical protein
MAKENPAPNPKSGQPVGPPQRESASAGGSSKQPKISLPKGGGAIHGIEEKFEVNAVTGTAGFSIPLPGSPTRQGFAPQLALSYDSGGGNSPFGLGWNVGVPAIARKTEKKLPEYRDAEESDVFILSGAEDMVPLLEWDEAQEQWKRNLYRLPLPAPHRGALRPHRTLGEPTKRRYPLAQHQPR